MFGTGVVGLELRYFSPRRPRVTIFERDCAPVPPSPDTASERFDRDGVTHPPASLPTVASPICSRNCGRTGCASWRPRAAVGPFILMPAGVVDRTRADDERLRPSRRAAPCSSEYLRARRTPSPVRGFVGRASVRESWARPNGVPRVIGVRRIRGAVPADLVVDAMGRALTTSLAGSRARGRSARLKVDAAWCSAAPAVSAPAAVPCRGSGHHARPRSERLGAHASLPMTRCDRRRWWLRSRPSRSACAARSMRTALVAACQQATRTGSMAIQVSDMLPSVGSLTVTASAWRVR